MTTIIDSALASKPITNGAGVDPRKVCRPGKRLRNWHRSGSHRQMSLRAFVRGLAFGAIACSDADRKIAANWLTSKGARP